MQFLASVGAFTFLADTPANAVSYPETVLADGPIVYYRLEDAAGSTTVMDNSSSGSFPGSVVFDELSVYPKFEQPGVSSNSVSFKGVGQKSQIAFPEQFGYYPEINQPGPFSVEAWVRPASAGTDYRSPVSNFGGWGDSSGWHFYQSPGEPTASTWIWVQKGGGIWVGGVPVRKNQWDYLAAVFDGTTVTFYVNGVASGSANASTALPNSGLPLTIGGNSAGNWWFDGNVDDVAIYNKALTVDQLRTHYEVGLTNLYSGPIPASVTDQPAPVTAYAGRPVKFVVGSDGTAPLSYQWYKGTTPIADATSDTLAFTAQDADNNATYHVVITNAYGATTSAPAALTVSRDLLLASGPDTITRTVGSSAAFIAVPDGALPFSYQWYKGSTEIAGATNQSLWLYDLTAADDNTAYYAKISNPWFSTNTEPATLTVEPRTVTVPETDYSRIVLADEPVAYWRLNETDVTSPATDAVGSFDGEYNDLGAGNYSPGEFEFGLPTGIPRESDKAVRVSNGARVTIPYALELNPRGHFSAEAWVKPESIATDPQDYRTIFSSLGSGPTGWLLYQQPNNTLAWVVFNDNWVSSFIGVPSESVEIEAGQWYHIVLTRDDLFHIYVNGNHVAAQPYDIFIPNRDGATHLGWRSDNDWHPFEGTIDDVAFYNKALSLDQVQSHYFAAIRLGASYTGEDLILTWSSGTLQQADQANGTYTDVPNATSPYTTSPATGTKFFRLKLQ